jgi:hypothetical protein
MKDKGGKETKKDTSMYDELEGMDRSTRRGASADEPKGGRTMSNMEDDFTPSAGPRNFKEAFRSARSSGAKDFTFGGKKYNTKLREEGSASTPARRGADASTYDRDYVDDTSAAPAAPAAASAAESPMTRAEFDAMERKAKAEEADRVRQGMGSVATKPNFGIAPGRTVDPTVLNAMKAAGGMKKGGKVEPKKSSKKYAGGGSVVSASRRADGCAVRGKTKGRIV